LRLSTFIKEFYDDDDDDDDDNYNKFFAAPLSAV